MWKSTAFNWYIQNLISIIAELLKAEKSPDNEFSMIYPSSTPNILIFPAHLIF